MEQKIEQPKKSSPEELADKIRIKINQKIPLSKSEEAFLREQKEENREDDNPYRR